MVFTKLKNQIACKFYSLQYLSNMNSLNFYLELKETFVNSNLTPTPQHYRALKDVDNLIEKRFNSGVKNGRKADEYRRRIGLEDMQFEQEIKNLHEKYHNSRLNNQN